MKPWMKIALIFLVIGILFYLYRKFLYFPHAKVIQAQPGQIIWTNMNDVVQSTITATTSGGGRYSDKYEYQITPLPNKQFRFLVYKTGNPSDIQVDNIFSLTGPFPEPFYLTK